MRFPVVSWAVFCAALSAVPQSAQTPWSIPLPAAPVLPAKEAVVTPRDFGRLFGLRSTPWFWIPCRHDYRDLPAPQHLLWDLSCLDTPLKKGSSTSIMVLDTDVPLYSAHGGALRDDLAVGFLIKRKSVTERAYAACIIHRLLSASLSLDDRFGAGFSESAEEDIESYKRYARFGPSLIIELAGGQPVHVEVDARQGLAYVRCGDKWTPCVISPDPASNLVSYAERICDLESSSVSNGD